MRSLHYLGLGLAALWSVGAGAVTISDPVGDFAPGYTGAAADLDVTGFSVNYNSATQVFTLGATMAGTINPATVGLYVIGVNTGTPTSAPFAAIGAPEVRFTQTFRVNKDGTGSIVTQGVTTALAPTITGSSFTVDVALALLPTTGYRPEQYGFNLWPRNGTGAGTFVTDFAPDNGLLAITPVPEPATWATLALGFGLLGAAVRRGRAVRSGATA